MLRRSARWLSSSAAADAVAEKSALVRVAHSKLSNDARIATLTLNHPVSRNAMTVGMGEQFEQHIKALKADKGLRAVVITGAGNVFSAGGEIGFLRARIADSRDGNIAAMRAFYSRFLCLRELPCPVIAAVNGHAIGAGFCVALACDFRVVSKDARLAVNFARIGIHPGMGATYSIPRLVGRSHASELLLTGREITAQRAFDIGLINTVCETDRVIHEATQIAESLGTASQVAVNETVATLRGSQAELDAALQREAEAQAVCYAQGRDLDEALNALTQRRAPKFVVE